MTTDQAIATATAAIEAARQAIVRAPGGDRTSVRIGLRQLAAALDTELEMTREQTRRCYDAPTKGA